MLVFRVRLASDAAAARFFGAYSEILEMKYDQRTNLMRRPNFFSFDTPEDGVFLRCMDSDCFVLEGGTRAMFDRLTVEMGWPAGPAVPVNPERPACQSDGVSALPESDCRCRSAHAAHGTVSQMASALQARACTLGGRRPEQ